MALLGKFDIDSDFTQFYLWLLIIVLLFTVLMTWVAPKKGKKVGRWAKVDDRYTSVEGELID